MSSVNIGDAVVGHIPQAIRATRVPHPAPGSVIRGTLCDMGGGYVTVAIPDGSYITLPARCVSQEAGDPVL